MTGRNYQPGVLANAAHGVPLHPQGQNVAAGGMTYRPPVAPVEALPVCSRATKAGDPCRAKPTATGLCMGHQRQADAEAEEAERTMELKVVEVDG